MTAPTLLWVHGGGLIFGAPENDDRTSIAFARELGITVAAVRYRLASHSPAPAAVEDAYAALRGLVAQARHLHIDIDRIAIGAASAGVEGVVGLTVASAVEAVAAGLAGGRGDRSSHPP
ncbi:alpha/beta hydrolase [Streptomyces caelestis]|uniref:alpha/beta hydrolase n=1 Tax=Streptomyces caelestis TaxID=36816 RepID=UPI0036FC5E09